MPSTASKALEVFALVAHVPSAISVAVESRRLLRLLLKWVHVPTAKWHRGAALRHLHLLLLRQLLDSAGDAVFGERLEGSLRGELGVVVEGEDGGFV
jgi:hypothetical protein